MSWIAATTGDSLTFTSSIIYSPMRIELLRWWIFIKTKTLKWPLGFVPFKFINMNFMGMSTSSYLIFLTNMMMIIIRTAIPSQYTYEGTIYESIYWIFIVQVNKPSLARLTIFCINLFTISHIPICFNHMRLFNKRSIEMKKIITFDVNIRYVQRYGKYEGEILSLPPYWHIIFMQLHLCLLIICSLFFFLCHFICTELIQVQYRFTNECIMVSASYHS